MTAKTPSFQFYPGDWLRDPALRSVSLAARGVWIDLLCLMHESTRRGYLIFPDGSAMKFEHLARIFSVDKRTLRGLISELESCGVFSREGEIIYSRRMVRDQRLSDVRRAAGKNGGNPLLRAEKDMQLDKQNERQILTPSSSSSSSSSGNPIVPAKSKQAKADAISMWDTPLEQLPEYWSEELRKVHPKPAAQQPIEAWCCDNWNRLGPERFAEFMAGEVLPALKKYAQYWASNGVQFATKLHVWLFEESWKKEIPATPAAKNPAGEEESIRFVPKPRVVSTEPEEPMDLSWIDAPSTAVKQ